MALGVGRARSDHQEPVIDRSVRDLDELVTELHVIVADVTEHVAVANWRTRDIDADQMRHNPSQADVRFDDLAIIEVVSERDLEPLGRHLIGVMNTVPGGLAGSVVPHPGAAERPDETRAIHGLIHYKSGLTAANTSDATISRSRLASSRIHLPSSAWRR